MSGVNIPTCLWAQTKEAVYVTVDVPDVTDEKISVDANVLKFSAKSGGKLVLVKNNQQTILKKWNLMHAYGKLRNKKLP